MKEIRRLQDRVYDPITAKPISSSQYAKKFSGDNDVYMSFTQINKIGINPQSRYSTPLGIYCYPVNPYLPKIKNDASSIGSVVPFAGDSKFVNFIRNKNNFRKLSVDTSRVEVEEYIRLVEEYLITSASKLRPATLFDHFWDTHRAYLTVYKSRTDILEKYFFEDTPFVESMKLLMLVIRDSAEDFSSQHGESENASTVLGVTLYVAHFLKGVQESSIGVSTLQNYILREVLGIGLVEDIEGEGFIHPSEPIQAFFTTTKAMEVIDRIQNVGFKDDRAVLIKRFNWFKNVSYGEGESFELKVDPIRKGPHMKDGIWKKGLWEDGRWEDGVWVDGTWEDGIWEDGIWQGGKWLGGTWEKGVWENGQWVDGYWKDGVWKNGFWQDGSWDDGSWFEGVWRNGIWRTGRWRGGVWNDGLWENGVWFGGMWGGGTWIDGGWNIGHIAVEASYGNFTIFDSKLNPSIVESAKETVSSKEELIAIAKSGST